MLFLRRNQSGCIYDVYFHAVVFRLCFGFTLNWFRLFDIFMYGRGYNYKSKIYYLITSSNCPAWTMKLFNISLICSSAGGKVARYSLSYRSFGISFTVPNNRLNEGYNKSGFKLIYPKYKIVRIK